MKSLLQPTTQQTTMNSACGRLSLLQNVLTFFTKLARQRAGTLATGTLEPRGYDDVQPAAFLPAFFPLRDWERKSSR